ncbi:MAG: hypothetical protein EP330_26035 [Deltaproteobacteria bacterium]|nr:MAG: hypothetical protein EP330_26035 [Deltaproteobacteria bacterium]
MPTSPAPALVVASLSVWGLPALGALASHYGLVASSTATILGMLGGIAVPMAAALLTDEEPRPATATPTSVAA